MGRGNSKRSVRTPKKAATERTPRKGTGRRSTVFNPHNNGLNYRQQMFVNALLADPDMNAINAHRKAYPDSAETSRSAAASGLLANNKIRAAIQDAMQDRMARTKITQDKVLREIAAIGLTKLTDVAEWTRTGHLTLKASDELTPDEAASISELIHIVTTERSGRNGDGTVTRRQIKFKLHDKLGALRDLAKHVGLFPDVRVKVEQDHHHTHTHTVDLSALTDQELDVFYKATEKFDWENMERTGSA